MIPVLGGGETAELCIPFNSGDVSQLYTYTRAGGGRRIVGVDKI